MKKILCLVFLLSSPTVFAQQFKFLYTTYGLGSNKGDDPELVVRISDTLLSYQIMEKTTFKIDPEIKDTLWTTKPVSYEVLFGKGSRDSIIGLLKGKEGQYIFASNVNVMSGSVQQLLIANKDWCVEYNLKNTFDSTALKIVTIINRYLPKDHPIYVPYELWTDRNVKPFIKSCPGDPDTKEEDILEEEYEYIRKQK